MTHVDSCIYPNVREQRRRLQMLLAMMACAAKSPDWVMLDPRNACDRQKSEVTFLQVLKVATIRPRSSGTVPKDPPDCLVTDHTTLGTSMLSDSGPDLGYREVYSEAYLGRVPPRSEIIFLA
ncbi:hypothetical protein DER45DRAFT_540096 [Fusarium avenaceum]|nr:hypothetical protein DER45DRAFT_540096 [Fusarium avenaceum]